MNKIDLRQTLLTICEEVPELWLYLEMKGILQFNVQLWSYALDLFRNGSTSQFTSRFEAAIEKQLTEAWYEGAKEMDVTTSEMDDGDDLKLKEIIDNEFLYVGRLADEIASFRTDPKMTREDFSKRYRARIDLWVNRYTETVNSAKIWFGKKQKLEWKLGATEEHCETCAALNGIIAFATEWYQSGLQPQSPPNLHLECQGWHCSCSLEPTKKRRTNNALDKLLDIATRHGL